MVGVQVSEVCGLGHPDKIADYIADYVLDRFLTVDPETRTGFEVLCSGGLCFLVGEVTCRRRVPKTTLTEWVREALRKVYHSPLIPIYVSGIHIHLRPQSRDIVKSCLTDGVRCPDQGCVYGYATAETPSYLPIAQHLARILNRHCYELTYRNGSLYPDYKMLVVCEDGAVKSITCSIRHSLYTDTRELQKVVRDRVVVPSLLEAGVETHEEVRLSVNVGGRFIVGGLEADSGATNRKLMVDGYGCNVEHGGGGLSGKDMSKPDRLLSYYARYIAKNAVASQMCSWCKIRLVFSYGADRMDGFHVYSDAGVEGLPTVLEELFDLPYGEIYAKFSAFDKFAPLAQFGHYGAEDLPWEDVDMAEEIAKRVEERRTSNIVKAISVYS